eukprot:Rhum_TRINITY_DN11115_c1_g1::Rhum_TRINITY_DN11115_c1_g1_i1::g.42412::m.42412/K07466/RFA1, RPA1, rpa; replication factor A1
MSYSYAGGAYGGGAGGRPQGGGGGGYGGGAPAAAPAAGGRSGTIPNFQGQGFTGQADFNYAEADKMLCKINIITDVYGQRWFIKARVSEKGPVKEWNNARGSGKLMSVTLVDDSGEAIRATFFKEGVDKFHDLLQEGQCYYIGNGRVKPAQKKFSALKHDYELSMDGNSVVQPISTSDVSASIIPQNVEAHFVELKDVPDYEAQRLIDVRAVVRSVDQLGEVKKKDGSGTLTKRSLRVVDPSTTQAFELTIWGDAAASFAAEPGQTVVARSSRVGRFMDNVTLSAGSRVVVDAPEAAELAQWWRAEGKDKVFEDPAAGGGQSKATRTGFDQVDKLGLGRGEKPDFLWIRATIVALNERMFYLACPHATTRPDGKPATCNKKVCDPNEETGTCLVHGEVTKPVARYMASLRVGDTTSQQFVTMFDEQAEAFFGRKAQEYWRRDDLVQATKKDVEWQPVLLTLSVKQDIVDGQPRMKYVVKRIKRISQEIDSRGVSGLVSEARALRREIDRYHNEKVR